MQEWERTEPTCQHPLPTDLSLHCSQIPPRDSHTEAGEALGTVGAFFCLGLTFLCLLVLPSLLLQGPLQPGPMLVHHCGSRGRHSVTQTQIYPQISSPTYLFSCLKQGGGIWAADNGYSQYNTPVSPINWEYLHSGFVLKPKL